MAGKENKVQFNLKNVHYAVMTTTGDTPAWSTPVKVPGAVSLSLDPQGEVSQFYADGIVYYQSAGNNGYNGDLTMARFPDQMLQEVWKYNLNETDKVLVENINVEQVPFALLFQIDGDADNQYYCLYNCSGTRPPIASQTNENTKTPQTQASTISAAPLENGNVLARTTSETSSAVKEQWFKKVYEPTAQAA